jgi:hypothetical protein
MLQLWFLVGLLLAGIQASSRRLPSPKRAIILRIDARDGSSHRHEINGLSSLHGTIDMETLRAYFKRCLDGRAVPKGEPDIPHVLTKMMSDLLNASEPLSRTCTLDPQVLALHQSDQAIHHTKYLIALDLKQSQALMPHMVRQILTLVVNMEHVRVGVRVR